MASVRAPVIVFCSATGGVGKSTLAAAVAWHASRGFGLRTCLVDLDLTAGCLHRYVPDALMSPSVLDLARGTARVEHVRGTRPALVPPPRPYDPEMEAMLGREALERVLVELAEAAELVVVDLGPDHRRSPAALAAWSVAAATLLVVLPHDCSVAASARLARDLEEAELGGQVAAAFNFARGDTDLDPAQAGWGRPLLGVVPFEAALAGAAPFPVAERLDGRDGWSRSVRHLSEEVVKWRPGG